MAVQWYPGHMYKAQKEIKKVMPLIDVVIEILDARIPYSSENPAIKTICYDRPCIKILNKADLADPEVTQQWVEYLEKEAGIKAIPLVAEQKQQARQLIPKIAALCKKFLSDRNFEKKPARVMIMGIPNVGKSTIMNGLAGKPLAKVGNEPAVTKRQQLIVLGNGIQLSDTPGILWPRMEDESTGYRLAITGAIKNTAMEYEDVALYAADFFLKAYPNALITRYKLTELPKEAVSLLETIGRKRGGLRSGGKVDMHKASEVLLHDFRAGHLGGLSLETPDMIPVSEQEPN